MVADVNLSYKKPHLNLIAGGGVKCVLGLVHTIMGVWRGKALVWVGPGDGVALPSPNKTDAQEITLQPINCQSPGLRGNSQRQLSGFVAVSREVLC